MNRFQLITIISALLLMGCSAVLGPSLGPGKKSIETGEYSAAVDYFESLIAAGSDSPKLYRFAYEAAFLNDDLSAAKNFYNAALAAGYAEDSLNSLAKELWYLRAKTRMTMDEWKSADQADKVLQSLAPDSDEAKFTNYMMTGYRLYIDGTHKSLWEALEDFELAGRLEPESGFPNFMAARTRYKNDRTNYDAALEEYGKALEIEPDGLFAAAARKEMAEIKKTKKKMEAFWGK